MVLLGLAAETGEAVLFKSMREALTHCLTANIKFKLAFAKWASEGADSHEKRVATFIDRAAEEFMVKELPADKIFGVTGADTSMNHVDSSSVLS